MGACQLDQDHVGGVADLRFDGMQLHELEGKDRKLILTDRTTKCIPKNLQVRFHHQHSHTLSTINCTYARLDLRVVAHEARLTLQVEAIKVHQRPELGVDVGIRVGGQGTVLLLEERHGSLHIELAQGLLQVNTTPHHAHTHNTIATRVSPIYL